MKSPYRTLGIHLRASGSAQIGMGWALIEQTPLQIPAMQREPMRGDHWAKVAQAVDLAKKKVEPGGHILLYRWSAARFHESQAAKEGGTWDDHLKLISDVRGHLELAGFRVSIETVTKEP